MRTSLVAQSVKFSYNIAKGSVEKRLAQTRQLDEQLYKLIVNSQKQNPTGNVLLADLRNFVADILPEDKSLLIRPTNKKDLKFMEAGADYLYDSKGNITGHILELPLKRKKLQLGNVPTMLHEMTHIFDKMLNPKTIARTIKLSRELEGFKGHFGHVDQYNNLYDKLYGLKEEQFTTAEEKFAILKTREKEIRKVLEHKKTETKLNILQNLRYQLGLELNAYTIENEYIDRMTPKGEDLSMVKTDVDKYLFRETIEIIEQIMREVIAKERAKIRRSINKN
ncbi:hypothetical protein IKP85_05325 [bacterium]|nr:hypothetical protein [bacterium]